MTTRLSLALTASLALAITACDGDEDTGDTDDTDDTDTHDTDTVPASDCPTDGSPGILTGTITTDMTLGPDCDWLLEGGVNIGNDTDETVLTILPGTQIFGQQASSAFLVITRGSKIMAQGTAADPIVFSSDALEGDGARGQWGGLILNGKAPVNVEGGVGEGEGGVGAYGGTDPADNSGVLEYVRIEYGGTAISLDNEINGLSLNGVGTGTTIDYIQVHANLDDGIEFFGGTVNAKHLVVSCPGDDGLDWDLGYVGDVQFALVTQGCDDAGNNGIEADNSPAVFDAEPRSNPTMSNITLVGNTNLDDAYGTVLRRGTDATLANLIATDFATGCLAIRDDETYAAVPEIDHTILDCTETFEIEEKVQDAEEDIFGAGTGNSEADPQLVNTSLAGGDPNFAPAAASPAASGGAVPTGGFFESASYLGAFDPAGPDWTDGWTNWDL